MVPSTRVVTRTPDTGAPVARSKAATTARRVCMAGEHAADVPTTVEVFRGSGVRQVQTAVCAAPRSAQGLRYDEAVPDGIPFGNYRLLRRLARGAIGPALREHASWVNQ